MKNRSKQLAYSDLAWTEPIIAPPNEYTEETEMLIKVIKEHSKIEVKTLLHLGCGAGGNDFIFKRHFSVTGVDISKNMLKIARRLNPEVAYSHGDMRSIELSELFNAVTIPDSIGYMTSKEDLRYALLTAHRNLKPGGVLLIVTAIAEQFNQNNFIYSGSSGDIEITVFENNYIPDPTGTTYKVTLTYLIRRKGRLHIYNDHLICGIFKLETWLYLLKEVGFDTVNQIKMDNAYDRFIAGAGKYPLLMLVCIKRAA